MKENLQRKVNLLAQNSKIVRKSAKLDFAQAANLGGLLFTSENLVAVERDIRANRKLLKKRISILNNMRGPAVNLSLLARMSIKHDAAAYVDSVIEAYDAVKASKIFKSEALVFTAMSMAEYAEPAAYAATAQAAWETLKKMRATHPLLTSQDDLTLAYLLNNAGINADALLDEAEAVYKTLKPTGFKLKKNTLQSVSMILAMSDKPLQAKCDRFVEIREALKSAGRRIYGEELAVVAAFVDVDKPAAEIVQDVADVDDALKHVTGFGPLLCGRNLRRLYSCALVLQAYGEETSMDRRAGDAVAETVVNSVITQIIMIIIMTTIAANVAVSSSNASAS